MSETAATAGAFAGWFILVLEDEALIAANVAMVFEDEGAEVRTARSVDGAQRIITERVPDGAVLDVTLGRNENCEPVAVELKRRNVPFILHSGDLDRQGEVIRRLNAPLIAKPAQNSDLVESLRKAAKMADS